MTEIFRLTMPRPDKETVPLYINGNEGAFLIEKSSVLFREGSSISFDTFFNLFSHAKYLKYTTITDVTLTLELSGNFNIKLKHLSQEKVIKVIYETEFNSASRDKINLPFSIEAILGGGFVYAELTAKENNCRYYGGAYFTDTKADNVRAGIVICTYRREQYVKNNMNLIERYLEENPAFSDRFSFFIIDNGNTLGDTEFPAFAKVFPNKNLGGAGGFTRGIMEVYAQKDSYTHFLLMDDDIVFEPEILNKTISFLSFLKPEYKNASIGAAMIPLDKPCLQYEFGAFWRDRYNDANLRNISLDSVDSLLANEKENIVDYSAWWYYCMPLSVVDRVNLPLPIFIKTDDIEYSLRGAEEVILLNGIAVWHEAFDNKPSDWLEYYIKRNELIVCAIHCNGRTMWKNYYKAFRSVAKGLVRQRYYKINLIFKAYEDFFKGPEFIASLDAEAYHKTILQGNPKLLTVDELNEKYGFVYNKEEFAKERHLMLTEKSRYLPRTFDLNGYLLPRIFYKKKYKDNYKTIDMIEGRAINFYKVNNAIQFNPGINMGFATKLKKTELFKSGFRLIKLYFKMLFCYKRTVKKYQKKENLDLLTSMDSWKQRVK